MRIQALALLALLIQDPDPREFLAMKPGTSWVYVSEGRELKVKVAGTEKLDDLECVVFESESSGLVQKDHFTVDAGGLRSVRIAAGARESRYDPPILRVKFPLKKGEKWEWKGTCGGREEKAAFTNEGEEEIEVKAGKFKAWKVFGGFDGPNGGSTSTTWYADGVGMIRQDTCVMLQGSIVKVSAELKSFERGK